MRGAVEPAGLPPEQTAPPLLEDVRTPRAPARACLPLLPSGPGGFTG